MIGMGLQLRRWGSSQLGFLPSSLSLPELFLPDCESPGTAGASKRAHHLGCLPAKLYTDALNHKLVVHGKVTCSLQLQ